MINTKIDNIYVRLITEDDLTVRNDYTPYISRHRLVPVKQIPVRFEQNEQDWDFAWIKRDPNVYAMAVF